jgi:uroporphyrin-III C-methyltransferase
VDALDTIEALACTATPIAATVNQIVTPDAAAPPATAAPPPATEPTSPRELRMAWLAALALGVVALGAAWLAYQTGERVSALEQELVRRQQESTALSTEARVLAKEAQEVSRDAAAKVALVDARVAESAMQRSQLEELLQALSRSRDENMLADIDAAVRVAVQQSAITGSTEPLLATLKQADERLTRNAQPRVERVRRAVVQDLERVRSVAVSDIATLVIKIDEAVRMVDELPLLAQPERRATPASEAAARAAAAASAGAWVPADGWRAELAQRWALVTGRIWDEARALVRVTRIENPEAMLLLPEQAWFLRENLKLRLLNARLALLSRQFATAQTDLREAQRAVERYFDRNTRRVTVFSELLRQVGTQARGISVPRPDETLAALAAALAGR